MDGIREMTSTLVSSVYADFNMRYCSRGQVEAYSFQNSITGTDVKYQTFKMIFFKRSLTAEYFDAF